jgi:hypothetical protein
MLAKEKRGRRELDVPALLTLAVWLLLLLLLLLMRESASRCAVAGRRRGDSKELVSAEWNGRWQAGRKGKGECRRRRVA